MKNEFVKRFTTSLIVFLISFFLIIKGNIYFNLLLILILFIALIEWFNLCKNKRLFILGSFFLFISLYTTSIFRDENLYFFILIILISISSDIGGYVFGKLFKGPKLTKISPNKTYSGSIGSYFFSLIISLIF
jgi:phosphatidate cytidylyltransferase